MFDPWLWSLFTSAFISATLFPGGSEAVLAALTLDGEYTPCLLIAVATLGNTLGGMSSWLLGRWLATKYPAERLAKERQQKAIAQIQRFGSPILILAWLPIIGDPLCLAAGWLRIHWLSALVWIGLGKAARYLVVWSLASSFSG